MAVTSNNAKKYINLCVLLCMKNYTIINDLFKRIS